MSVVDAFQDEAIVEFYRAKLEPMTSVGAAELLRVSGLATAPSASSSDKLQVLDNASGAGIVSSILLSNLHGHTGISPRKDVFVQATDDSAGMCAHIERRAVAESWPTDSFKVDKMDSQALSLPDNRFDFTITSYGVFLMRDPVKGMQEIYRVTKNGGVMAFNTWTHLFWLPVLRDAAPHISFPVMEAPAVKVFEKWADVEYARSQAEQAGLKDIKTSTIEWDVKQENAQAFGEGISAIMPGILGITGDEKKIKEVQDGMLKVVKEKHGSDDFNLKAGSACFVATK